MVQPIIREQEQQKKKIAEEKRQQAEAEQQRIAEEKRKRLEWEARDKWLTAVVRERLRFYDSTDGYIPRAGRRALDALKKLEARVEIEVTYEQYRDLCGQTWGDIRLFVESEKGEKVSEFSEALTTAISEYKSALDLWRVKLGVTSAARRVELEGALQESWSEASRAVRLASSIQDERTRGSALRDYYTEKEGRLANTKANEGTGPGSGSKADGATSAAAGKPIDLLSLIDPTRDNRKGE